MNDNQERQMLFARCEKAEKKAQLRWNEGCNAGWAKRVGAAIDRWWNAHYKLQKKCNEIINELALK